MPTNILGVSAFYHDSAACLVRDGQIVAAAQEERFTRKKFDARFPAHAIRYCLSEGAARILTCQFEYVQVRIATDSIIQRVDPEDQKMALRRSARPCDSSHDREDRFVGYR